MDKFKAPSLAQADNTPTLQLEDIRKSYGTGTAHVTEVLHGINLTLARGEFVALIGPSGSGKSTLLNIIGLLDKPTAGKLFLKGQEAENLPDMALTRLRGDAIGFVFQFHNLLPAFTAVENVMLPLLAMRGKPDLEMRKRAEELIEKVGLKPWGHHLANDLSGGQQQRVAIARALIMQPALVLADEPTGNLDTQSADTIFDLMRNVSKTSGTTFLIVTHDPRLAKRCDRIVELVDGQVESDKPNVATPTGESQNQATSSTTELNSNKPSEPKPPKVNHD
ncbi:MAG: ABC transporter ATP-binding protein [Burkholderiaceae bacterium]